jgi:hypothetical protein
MPVVRNDGANAFQVSGGGNVSRIEVGEVRYLTDDEYSKIGWSNRGPGKIVSIAPNENTSETQKIKFDYIQPDVEWVIGYIGYARQTAADSDPVWTIRKHFYQDIGGYRVTEIQVLENVAWTDRLTLPWT